MRSYGTGELIRHEHELPCAELSLDEVGRGMTPSSQLQPSALCCISIRYERVDDGDRGKCDDSLDHLWIVLLLWTCQKLVSVR